MCIEGRIRAGLLLTPNRPSHVTPGNAAYPCRRNAGYRRGDTVGFKRRCRLLAQRKIAGAQQNPVPGFAELSGGFEGDAFVGADT